MKYPDAFEFVDAIPKTSTGKFLKAALRQQHWIARGGDAVGRAHGVPGAA
jgi:acyl-CoA synthetase (AMP-forming)/AMP-acid ligase II